MVWRVWGAGEPLVLFHGGSGSWTHWIRNIPELSRHYELWVADIPGPRRLDDAAASRGCPRASPTWWSRASTSGVAAHRRGCAWPASRSAARSPGSRPPCMGDRIRVADADRRCRASACAPTRASRSPSVRMGMSAAEIAAVYRQNLAVLMFADPANIDALAVHLQAENIKRARFRSRPFAPTDNAGPRARRRRRAAQAPSGARATSSPGPRSRRGSTSCAGIIPSSRCA